MTGQQRLRIWTVLLCMALITLILVGCNGVKPTAGGTPGTLRMGANPPGDIQLTVYRQDADVGDYQPVGLATTAEDGAFGLMKNAAEGPLWLSPGNYRITVESAGNPLQIDPKYATWQTTPLKVKWQDNDERMDLNIENAEGR